MGKIEYQINPYFESVHNLADLNNASLYVSELGCKYSQCFNIRRAQMDDFRKSVKDKSTAFFGIDGIESFEAHIVDKSSNKILIIFVQMGHSSFFCSMFSNTSLEHIFQFVEEHEEAFIRNTNHEIDLMYFYKSTSRGFSTSRLYISRDSLRPIYSDLYPDIDIDKLLKSYLNSRDSILMLYGIPGVGKTTFIKFLLAAGDFNSVAYVKDPDVMGMGDLWGNLTSNSYDLIIFDDLDVGLLPREKSINNHFMTQLLSFSDGIFHNNKTKIIMTTNQNIDEIDAALVRPGRCFDFLQLHPLSREQAKSAWVDTLKLDEKKFDLTFGDIKTITQAALMSECGFHKSSLHRDYVKSGDKNYTLDQKLEQLNIKVANSKEKTGFGL